MLRVEARHLCGFDDSHCVGQDFSPAVGPREHPVFSSNDQFPFILPMSGKFSRVHYRWHAYSGSDVRVSLARQRGDGRYVALERDPGVAIMSPAWVLDAVVCSTLSTGDPLVSTAA